MSPSPLTPSTLGSARYLTGTVLVTRACDIPLNEALARLAPEGAEGTTPGRPAWGLQPPLVMLAGPRSSHGCRQVRATMPSSQVRGEPIP